VCALKDRTRRVSHLRLVAQVLFLLVVFELAVIGLDKILLIIVIFGATLVLGKFFCGWICPFGLYMDLITLLRRALRIRYWTLSERINMILHKLRYVIALVIVSSVLLLFFMNPVLPSQGLLEFVMNLQFYPPFRPLILFLSPLETLVVPFVPPFGALFEFQGVFFSFPYVGEIAAATYGSGFTFLLAVTFVSVTVVASFKVRRFWCRFCPTGISLAVFNRFKGFKWAPLLHLYKVEEKCTKCGICKRVCPTQVVEVYDKKGGRIGTSRCVLCLRCVEMCPYEDCLKLEMAGKTLFKSSNWLEN
jgi:ferredoxin-type protein NapH